MIPPGGVGGHRFRGPRAGRPPSEAPRAAPPALDPAALLLVSAAGLAAFVVTVALYSVHEHQLREDAGAARRDADGKAGQAVAARDDAEGRLRDGHWASGMIGYFTTYTLGNVFASQRYARAEADVGGFDAAFARGDFGGLLGWLREKVQRRGASRRRPG
jgi:hypothetical protein